MRRCVHVCVTAAYGTIQYKCKKQLKIKEWSRDGNTKKYKTRFVHRDNLPHPLYMYIPTLVPGESTSTGTRYYRDKQA